MGEGIERNRWEAAMSRVRTTVLCATGFLVGVLLASTVVPPKVSAQPPVDPNRHLGDMVYLPMLDFAGQDDVCRSTIAVQSLGCEPAKAVLLVWGEPGYCPPQAAGPLKAECTGLLRPGASWFMVGAQIPTGAKGGMLFKFLSA